MDHPLASFDRAMEDHLRERKIPGGALAVIRGSRLVHAKGYGWADRETRTPVEADSLFRIASISKPITAVAVLRLVEQGRLKLDDCAFHLLKLDPILEGDARLDPRLRRITIRQLLAHTGGWDRDVSGDPMFMAREIARAAGVPAPADPTAIIRYLLGRPLDFDPGTRYVYSNFGYCVLGRLIEAVSGGSYETFIQANVLTPAGITGMRLGRSLIEHRAPREVRYHMPDDSTGESVFPSAPDRVPEPYGTFNLEAMDAHGGWLASAVDLARFAAAFGNPPRSPLLGPAFVKLMAEPPPPPVSRTPEGGLNPAYYGCGWWVRQVGADRLNHWHTGSLPGTSTLLVRRHDGLAWAVLFNQRSGDRAADAKIDPALHRAADAVTTWPEHDLFATL